MGRQLGERVVLREYRAEDISALRAWVNDGETTRYLGGAYRRPQTWEQTEDWLNRRLNGDLGGESFVIAEKDSQKYLGQCDLMMIDSVARKAEIALPRRSIASSEHTFAHAKPASRRRFAIR